jgi:hypothetical protein
MLKRFPVLALFLLTAFAVACGGGSSGGPLGSGGSSGGTADPKAFTTQYYTTIFASLGGTKTAQDLANLFTPPCRENVKVADIRRGIEDEQKEVPKIKGKNIDNVDFGDKFKAVKKDNGYTVTIPSSRDSKIHVDGKWLNAHDFLVSVDFEKEDSKTNTEDLELMLFEGKLYSNDCESLQSIAKAESTPTPTPRSGTATPTPRSGTTPTPTQRAGSTPTPGSGSSATLSATQANDFAKLYLQTIVGALAGTKTGQDVINVFAPDCQKLVKVADVNAGIANEAKNYPKLKGLKVDDIDFGGKVKSVKSGNGYTITAPSSNDTKVKVGTQTLNAHTWLMSVGLEDSTEGDETSDIEVVIVGGKVYSSECDTLQAIAN